MLMMRRSKGLLGKVRHAMAWKVRRRLSVFGRRWDF
jgi:hypothetical protein